MALKKKLDKLQMPKKRQEEAELDLLDFEGEEPEMEMQLDSDELPSEEDKIDAELPEGLEGQEMPSSADLEAVSDDELMAELKKRGLMGDMDMEQDMSEMPPSDDQELI